MLLMWIVTSYVKVCVHGLIVGDWWRSVVVEQSKQGYGHSFTEGA